MMPFDSTTDANAGKSEISSRAAARPSRHDEFYFTDEMTVFQVENRLFRVHRYILTENSPIFSSMFSLPRDDQQVSSTAAEGTSDANPIYLSGVTELEFETLLRFFLKGANLPQESWMVLLSIAHRYEFLSVRERAIEEIYGPFRARQKSWNSDMLERAYELERVVEQELQDHDYQMLISVAEKYDIPLRHIVPLLFIFVVRKQPLTVREVLRFSTLTLTKLAHAREDYLRESTTWRLKPTDSRSWTERNPPDVEEIVNRAWKTVAENENDN